VVGAVLVIIAVFIVGPIGLFLVGGTWSAVNGWLLSDDADARAGAGAEADTESAG
jgi:hypothetical protein